MHTCEMSNIMLNKILIRDGTSVDGDIKLNIPFLMYTIFKSLVVKLMI